ncbi:hypothetical protein BO71DRAFT_419146 [Aspergillus ellipticus CBS 707.79]|uniref:H+/nucleoside cotransporter n=1 Tax=Aspergillus ellipticus CBS 707.79 TaxID=1448320 RepID=A0A319EU65_9EURO|nr:hypothetical protein BO71DRAFT_419146 [Aspergillus ellipticus CBS 707.79]
MADEKATTTSQMTATPSPGKPMQPADPSISSKIPDQDDAIYTTKNARSSLGEGSHQSKSEKGHDEASPSYSARTWYSRYVTRYFKHLAYAAIWVLFTGWWITGLIFHRYDLGWLIPFLLYLAITLKLIFLYIPISVLTRPVFFVWNQTASRLVSYVPERLRIPGAGLITIAVILVGSFVSTESADNTRTDRAVSLFGLVVFLFVLWLSSRNRKIIVWHTVTVGMLVQFIVALFVLRTKAGYDIFNFISTLTRELLSFAEQGVDFLIEAGWSEKHSSWFLVSVIPAIMFLVSLVQLLFHTGVLQWAIRKFAIFFFWCMRVSGAEAVVAAASPFIGQSESAMLIKPFIPHLTMAEVHQIMCSGFATIAGSVLVAYIGMGVNPQALISSCVMSIPASLAASKLRWPEEEETLTAGRVVVLEDDEQKAANALHAFTNGAWMGIKIAGMIAANLLCIISLVGLINALLTWWGHYLNINNPPLTIQFILGYLCYPIAFLLGVPRNGDLLKVAKLIGTKLVLNEFVAYNALQNEAEYHELPALPSHHRIGVLAQLAPNRAGDVSRVAVSAMLTGAISTFTSAAIAGMLITDEKQYFQPSS